ncbi:MULTISPECIES: aldo/keto reductase [unclassified Nonomuraea]|uniref:aldo/keto reductase n=1 Tax=unclassified Nonomuraea TaxID=2593643 RepID=UPI0033D1321C
MCTAASQSPDMEKGYGVLEEIIGRWLAQGGGRGDRIVLATKVYQPMDTGPNDQRLSAYHIRRACDESLRRLQTDHIDLYQMHHVDRSTPWEDSLLRRRTHSLESARRWSSRRRLAEGERRPPRRRGHAAADRAAPVTDRKLRGALREP